ncbi:MAG TPA: GTP cyclohydrolase II [Anaerolineales bacterium]
MTNEQVERRSCARIPTAHGDFELCLYSCGDEAKDHLAMVYGQLDGSAQVLVRVHSECFTGDVMGSQRCDCGAQFERSMALIAESGAGIILYLRQEGRGIGLLDKLRAYNLQDEGYDTVDANLLLGHEPDERDYRVAAAILKDLGVRSIRLITNNPNKIDQLQAYGIAVEARVPLVIPATTENATYLRAKSSRLNHILDLDGSADDSEPSEIARRNGRRA